MNYSEYMLILKRGKKRFVHRAEAILKKLPEKRIYFYRALIGIIGPGHHSSVLLLSHLHIELQRFAVQSRACIH